MREAARALDDVSDHLGEVLRRADELLVEWSTFAAQVRGQVEREAAAVGHLVEGAVGRVAAQGVDRAIGDRLRALTAEIERLEQRTRAASRAAVEQRDRDRRVLWAVVAGVVLANAMLVVLLLRKPAAAPAAEPIRLDTATAPPSAEPAQGSAQATTPAAPVTEPPGTGSAGAPPAAGAAPAAGSGSAGTTAAGSASQNAAAAAPAQAGSGSAGATKAAGSGAHGNEPAPHASPMAYPPRPGAAHPHKKLP